MRILLYIFFLLLSYSCVAQNGATNASGARSNGVANASITFTDVNSLFSNQAGLAFLEKTAFMVAAERRFSLAELNNLSAGVALPIQSGTFGLAVNYFGFDLYNETKIGLSYARKLMEKLSFGAQIDFLGLRIPEYGNKNWVTFEAGIYSELMKGVTIGVHIFSPIRIATVDDEYLPTVLRAGATYQPSDKVRFHAELEKDIDFPFIFKSGLEYELVKDFWVRIGASTNPTTMSFGIGYQLKNGFRIDAASNYHQELGFSPGVSLGMALD